MMRRVLNLLTLVSLLLCVAVVAVWARSHFRSDWITHRTLEVFESEPLEGRANSKTILVTSVNYQVWSGSGNVQVSRISGGWIEGYDDWKTALHTPEGWSWLRDKVEDPAPAGEGRTLWNRLGFEFGRRPMNSWPGATRITVGMPLWFIAAVLGVMPALRARRALARRRRQGQCPTCGYDLRATPAKCPECGAVPLGVTA